jgi:4-hydroxybenzoate polyprenyltransferase
LVKKRQSYGIIGIILAAAGGAAWFLQQQAIALILWGIAVIIIFRLNARRKKDRKRE